MVKRKQFAEASAKAVPVPPLTQPSKIPNVLRFPTLVLASMALSSLLYSVNSQFGTGDLATVMKRRDEWWEIGGLLAWKSMELAIGWWGEYDAWDVVNLTALSHMPYLYLLTTFYTVRPTTMWSGIFIDILSIYVPFSLMRDSSPVHRAGASKDEVANRSIVNDIPVMIYTSILAAIVYGLVVYGSFHLWIPEFLIVHFDGLKDLGGANEASFPMIIVAFVMSGIAAQSFLFIPALGAKPDAHDLKMAEFDPETATFGETLWWNVWGYSKRSRTLIKRTATLALTTAMQTGLRTYITVAGVELVGASGWAAMWAAISILVGGVLWWVGDVNGVSN
ncbi:MAG: hypothetical protein LQ350_002304 [Teloschistes chrysophthalmus]|nr:MAG: hypothetical protein LQ350_002304 [Niorma chrysophthalma]